MFFSTTDGRGIITSGNEVFVRISGYDAQDLVGKAHNIVRHPDMPRSAFRIVWERLKAGKAVAALVKNLAKDGCHYWVVALISPTPGGYLSVRFKPTGAFQAVVEPLYAQACAAEQKARESGADAAAAMERGAEVLSAGLQAAKFSDYDAFMWVLLCEELKARDAVLAREHRSILRPLPSDAMERQVKDPALAQLATVYRGGGRAYEHLNRLYRRIDDFVALNETLDRKSSFVNNLTSELRISAINVALASARAGGEGQGLGVISRHMGESSGDVAAAVNRLVSGIGNLSGRLRGVIFNLASARLQLEMGLIFVRELLGSTSVDQDWKERRKNIHVLHEAFLVTMKLASEALHELEQSVRPLGTIAEDLERHVLSLQVAQVGGVVESTRISEHLGFRDIFSGIRQQIDRTHDELLELSEALHRLDRLADETPTIARDIEAAARQIGIDIQAMSTGDNSDGIPQPVPRIERPAPEEEKVDEVILRPSLPIRSVKEPAMVLTGAAGG
jgi:aerotaxis receptor